MIRKLLNRQVDRFEAIHRVVMDGVARDWVDIWIQVECEGSGTSVARFVKSGKIPQPTYVGIAFPDFAPFIALNRDSNPRWTTMTLLYTRNNNGATHFKAEAGYEPVPIENEYERRLAWKAKYLTPG